MNKTEKILYYTGQICVLLILWTIIQLLPLIFKASWQGALLILTLTIFLIVRLYFYLPENKKLTKIPIYNVLIIAIAFYFLLVYYRIYDSIDFKRYLLSEISMEYCKTNFVVLSCALLGVVFNSFLYKITYND